MNAWQKTAVKVVLVIVLVTAFCVLLARQTTVQWSVSSSTAKRICLEHGYGEMVYADTKYFCVRLVDGNTEVKPLEHFTDGG